MHYIKELRRIFELTRKISKLTVFLGANPGYDSIYKLAAERLGKWLAAKNITLIYGGGKYGLMGVLAKSTLEAGGEVFGIITKELEDRDTGAADLTKQTVVSTMSERKEQLISAGDGILTFPGGIGTLEEFSMAASAINLGDSSKPVALYNINHYYDPLEKALHSMVDQGFYGEEYFDSIDFDDDLDSIYQFMVSYKAPLVRKYR